MSYFEFEETHKSNTQNNFIESFIKDSIKEINENLIQDDIKNNIINSNNNKLNHDDIILKLKEINKGLTSLHHSIKNNISTGRELNRDRVILGLREIGERSESTGSKLTHNNIILKLQEIDEQSEPTQEDKNNISESTNTKLNQDLFVNKKKKTLNYEKIQKILEKNDNDDLPNNVNINVSEKKRGNILDNFNTKLNIELAKNIIYSKEILNDQTKTNKVELILNKVVSSFENLLVN
jgi:hypothetical protein